MPPPVRSVPLAHEGDAQRRARRVLVIDDDADNGEGFAAYLELNGHVAAIARTGEAALVAAPEFRPDVVLLDIGLPGIDGHETCRRLRAAGITAVIAALTGWGQQDDRQRTTDAGFDHHLVKPVNPDAVLALVESAPIQSRPA